MIFLYAVLGVVALLLLLGIAAVVEQHRLLEYRDKHLGDL